MELIPSETSLVVAGAWNAAILTPAWMNQHAFQRAAGDQARLQVFFPAIQGPTFEVPRFVMDDLAYVVRSDALILSPTQGTADNFAFLEASVARALRVLSHTPISGVGHNFEFRDAAPRPESLRVFTNSRQDISDEMPIGWAPGGIIINSTFKNQAGTVLISMQREWNDEYIAFKFNFHHPVVNVEQALSVLEHGEGHPSSMAQNLAFATELVEKLYPQGQQ